MLHVDPQMLSAAPLFLVMNVIIHRASRYPTTTSDYTPATLQRAMLALAGPKPINVVFIVSNLLFAVCGS